MDPNFPVDLNIHPSSPYQKNDSDNLDVNFGLVAQESAIRRYGIAGRVWEASYALTLYLSPSSQLEFDPPMFDTSKNSYGSTIIELGSGSGLVASSLVKLLDMEHDRLIATDLPEVCPLLEVNLRATLASLGKAPTDRSPVTVNPLSWGKHEDVVAIASRFFNEGCDRPLTHIICSDLVYFPELLGPLLRSLLHLSSHPFISFPPDESVGDPLTIFISYKLRSLSKETPFWTAFGLWFEFQPVLVKDKSKGDNWEIFGNDFDDTTFIFVAHRRPESYTWTIPSHDEELLAGVGAFGTDTQKSDDTFESLLLMSLL